MKRYLDSGEVAVRIGAGERKDIYLLVKFGILKPFRKDFGYRFRAEDIDCYKTSIFDKSGKPQSEKKLRCVNLRRQGCKMKRIVELTHLPLTWVRSILEDRGMGNGYRAGTKGAYRSNRTVKNILDGHKIAKTG